MSVTLPRWPAISLVSAAAVALAVYGGLHGSVRHALVLWFVLVCPGLSLVRLLRIGEAATELMLALALSIALSVLVASVMLYAGLWSPPGVLGVLIGLTLGANALDAATGRAGPREVPAG